MHTHTCMCARTHTSTHTHTHPYTHTHTHICTLKGLPNPFKLYAVKLLFNFTHEYSSIVRNIYKNEWLILSPPSPL